MSQVSYGTITINDITDISDVFLQYGLAISSATVTNNYAFNGLGERGWFIAATGAVDANTVYFEYDSVNQVYKVVTNPSSTSGLYISAPYPTWSSGYQIWIRQVTIKEGIDEPEYGTPYLDTAVNQIQNNYIGLSNKLRTFFYPGDSTYSGAFAVSKTSTDGLNTANANTYGFNTRVASALISMGYNKIPLLEMGLLGSNFNGIKLYSPILTNNVITGNRLDATLTSEGLKLLKGGIEAGIPNQSGFIYLSTEPYGSYSINSSTDIIDWKEIIGTKFGVREDGTLYASNAVISGQITVGSGSNVYTITEVDEAFESKGSAIEEINKYITSIGDTGIKVHPYNDTTSTIDQNNYTKIDSNGMEIFKDSVSISKFGEVTRIGTENDASISITDSAITGVGQSGKVFFDFKNSASEMTVYHTRNTGIAKLNTFPTSQATAKSIVLVDETFIDLEITVYCSNKEFKSDKFTFGTQSEQIITMTFTNGDSFALHLKYDGARTVYHWLGQATSSTRSIQITHVTSLVDTAPAYIIGTGTATGGYALAEGYSTLASGNYSHAEGTNSKSEATATHAEGRYTRAVGEFSHAEGNSSKAYGKSAHAEGTATTAYSQYSHAEGHNSIAGIEGGNNGQSAHAEGDGTLATGNASHAEGISTVASGANSHAGGTHTIAAGNNQTAIGSWNVEDTDNQYSFIIGRGNSSARKNAFTVDWSGNVDIASGAKYKINGTNLAPSDLGEVDYIVEQGTNGGWYYRKWNSGRLDADRVWNVGQVTLNTAEGTTHRVSADLTIPTPSMMVNGTVAVTYAGTSSNSPTFIERTASDKVRIAKVITSNVTLQNVTFTLQLIGGTWK